MLAKTCHQPIKLQDCMDPGVSFLVPNLALKHVPIIPSVQVRFNDCQKYKATQNHHLIGYNPLQCDVNNEFCQQVLDLTHIVQRQFLNA
jgi:hypothetical protein